MFSKIFKGFSTAKTLTPNTKLTDVLLILQDITNNFSITKGEKLENPNFGSRLSYLLFEPFTLETVQAIEDDVVSVVNFDPRCRLNSVVVTQTDDQAGVNINCNITFVTFSVSSDVTWRANQDGSIYMTS